MKAADYEPGQGGGDFGEIVGRAAVARGGFATEDEVFVAEDADSGGAGDEANGDADEQGHHGHGFVVDGRGQDLVAVEVETREIGSFLSVLGQSDDEASECGDAHLEPEAGFLAVLLEHGSCEAKVQLIEP